MKTCGSSNSPVASARFFTRLDSPGQCSAGRSRFYAMEADDVAEVPNGLMAARHVVSIPYCEQIELAEMPVTAFEMNVAYATT